MTKNWAQCRKCGDRIESVHVHDFVRCSCDSIFVDGGREYWRWGWKPEDFIRLDDDGKEVVDDKIKCQPKK